MTRGSSPFYNGSYHEWLVNLIGFADDEYHSLLATLQSIIFVPEFMMDENRVEDALDLRSDYYHDGGEPLPLYGQVSMLELMVALAYRTEDAIGTLDRHDIFKMFLENMKIDKCTEEWFCIEPDPEAYVEYRCDITMHHEYRRNGSNGGLFVVNKPDRDFRKEELFWQMQNWMREQNIPDM